MKKVVTTPIIKSDTFPAFGRAAALFSGGRGTWLANRRWFYDELYECCN
jgi:hypothetical protein